MNGLRDGLTTRLHVAVAVLVAWLVLTSPWISMLRRVPTSAGFFDLAHVWLGAATLGLGAWYFIACLRGGGWRLYFPWLAGQGGAALRDLGGLLRGQIPSAEGGGLFGLIEGLLLLALLITSATGAGWWAGHGADWAMALRKVHLVAADSLMALAVAHVVTVSLHLLEFLRD